jgi:assimilatory nitrate reductase catalytic subunit
MSNVGYVARQKVDGGYLYRIRSPMEITELQKKIERLLPSSSSADKLICRDDSSIKGMAAVVENKVTSLYKLTKDEPSDQEVQTLSALFNSSADEGSSLHALLGN